MKKMKRLLALVLAGVLALAMFTACGTPDEAAQMKNYFTGYVKEAVPGIPVGQDAELQQFLAEQTQENWSEDAKVFDIDTKDGTALISIIGTYSKKALPVFRDEGMKKNCMGIISRTATEGAEQYKVAATKAEVYTEARGDDVIISYVLFFPTAKTAD